MRLDNLKLNKNGLVSKVAKQTGIPKDKVMEIVNQFLIEIARELIFGKFGKVELRGFGAFKVKVHAASRRRNPATGELMNLAPHWRCIFTPGMALRKKLKEKGGESN